MKEQPSGVTVSISVIRMHKNRVAPRPNEH
jgi:hypothetical protein